MTSTTLYCLLVAAIALLTPHSAFADQDYETIRFYTKLSKPDQIGTYAFSPNGRYLALSLTSNLASTPGLSLVDLEKQELAGQAGQFSFFTLAFSSDSQKVLGIGGYAGFQLIDIHTKSVRKLTKLPAVQGKIGIGLHEKNGKLLIQSIEKNFNPTLGDKIRVGDEVLALNEGEKSVRYGRGRFARVRALREGSR